MDLKLADVKLMSVSEGDGSRYAHVRLRVEFQDDNDNGPTGEFQVALQLRADSVMGMTLGEIEQLAAQHVRASLSPGQ